MSALRDCLTALVGGLAGYDWFVFGAQAVSIRGVPRTTQDVDVTCIVAHEQLDGLVAAMLQAGFAHRYPELAAELLESGAVLPLVHNGGFEVDLVIGRSGLEMQALSRASAEELAGVVVPVASSTDLVVMKILAGRRKDIEDAAGLLGSGDVDEALAHNLLAQLDEALGRSDLVEAFNALPRR